MDLGHPLWVGENYAGGAFFGQRVLIVGESHYGNDSDDLTTEVVRDVRNGANYRFFTGIQHACLGTKSNGPARRSFWDSVAFMNFVTACLGESRDRPSQEALRQSGEAFLERVATLAPHGAPHRILVFSKLAWEWMPPFADGSDGFCFAPLMPNPGWCGCYDIGTGMDEVRAWAMVATHPSTRGWNPELWHPLITQFLATPLPPPETPREEVD